MDGEVARSRAALWAEKTVEAYAAEAKPALSSDTQNGLKQRITHELTKALVSGVPSRDWPACVNRALDEWQDLFSLSGPRLLAVDEVAETVRMGPRASTSPDE